MKVETTSIPDVLLITPKVFTDERGFFYESYNHQVFVEKTGLNISFVQDNHSRSQKNVLRGLVTSQKPLVKFKVYELHQIP